MDERVINLEQVYEQCAQGHPHVARDPGVLGGAPHVAGTRVKVSDLLARLYATGSIGQLVQYYGDVDEEQARDGVAYALRFMELVCEPRTPAGAAGEEGRPS